MNLRRPFLLLLRSLCTTRPAAAATDLEINRPAPAFTATLLDGTRFDLAAHRGEVVILNFWATWCAPCLEELPAFREFQEAHRNDGLSIVAVSMDDPQLRTRVNRLARDFGFPAAVIAETQAAGYGRIWRLPITFVIDRRGVLRIDGGAGSRKAYDRPALERDIGPLLRETP